MSKKKNSNTVTPLVRMIERTDFTRDLMKLTTNKWKVPAKYDNYLLALSGERYRSERLVASDLMGRIKAGEILAASLQKMSELHPDREFFLMSFTDDVGNTLDRVPTFRIEELKAKVCRPIRAFKLAGLVFLGVHPFSNYPRKGLGRQISIDAHAIVWLDGPWDYGQAQKEINRSRGWTSELGAKPVDIRPIKPDELGAVAFYLVKPWHSAKNVMPHKKKPDRMRLMDTRKGYRSELATRVFEGLSQVQLVDLMAGVNGGTQLRQLIREQLVKWHRARSEPSIIAAPFDVWSMWLELREVNGSKKYRPFRFDGSVTNAATLASASGRKPKPKRRLGNAPPNWNGKPSAFGRRQLRRTRGAASKQQ